MGTEEWTRGSGVYTHPGRGFHHLGWEVVGDLECGLFVAKLLFAKYGVYAFFCCSFLQDTRAANSPYAAHLPTTIWQIAILALYATVFSYTQENN